MYVCISLTGALSFTNVSPSPTHTETECLLYIEKLWLAVDDMKQWVRWTHSSLFYSVY